MSVNQIMGQSGKLLDVDDKNRLAVSHKDNDGNDIPLLTESTGQAIFGRLAPHTLGGLPVVTYSDRQSYQHIQNEFGFSGKVAGSLTECPHVAKAMLSDEFPDFDTGGMELGEESYSKLVDDDEDPYTNSAVGTGVYPQLRVRFNVLGELARLGLPGLSLSSITNLTLHVKGAGSGCSNGEATPGMTVCRWDGDAWGEISSSTEPVLSVAQATAPVVDFLIRPTHPAQEAVVDPPQEAVESTLSVEQVYFTIEYDYYYMPSSEAALQQVNAKLDALLTAFADGTAKVLMGGVTIEGATFDPDVTDRPARQLGEVTVTGDVADNIASLEAKIDELHAAMTSGGGAKVSLNGSLVTIGAKTYPVSNGDTLRGLAADKPAAADAHAVIPYCYYHSVDTGAIEVTTGSVWVVV
jgi:hypothetical protein